MTIDMVRIAARSPLVRAFVIGVSLFMLPDVSYGEPSGFGYRQCLHVLEKLGRYREGDNIIYDDAGWFSDERIDVRGALCSFDSQKATELTLRLGGEVVTFRGSEIDRIARLPSIEHVFRQIEEEDFQALSSSIGSLSRYRAITPTEKREVERRLVEKLRAIPASDREANLRGYRVLVDLTDKAEYREKVRHYSLTRSSRGNSRYIRGPRGGCYYLRNGNRIYVDRSLCRS